MYVLCDVNAMYASCEKVFEPAIRTRPVVVLTNNDGCICAACGIAKRLGVGQKFVPYFQMKAQLERAGVVVRSSNYELYADLSQRMMATCERFAPHSHVYSIDECFLFYGRGAYTPPEGWQAHARRIRRTVWKEVRLPIGVGVGPTPTLAKVANHAAKRLAGFAGVAVLDDRAVQRQVLAQMAASDVWGIGRRLAARLRELGIETGLQLADAPPGLIRKHFSVLVEGTVAELNGQVRLNWDEVRAPKKEIYSTRSFGQRVQDRQQLLQALASHADMAGRKLRKQASLTHAMVIFASSSPHDDQPYYRQSVFHRFSVPTADTRLLMQACTAALARIFQPGVRFYRCGVGLLDLRDTHSQQSDLFSPSQDNTALMQCMDQINSRFGHGAVQLARQGGEQRFAMRREFLSPQYSTRLSDLPRIRCEP